MSEIFKMVPQSYQATRCVGRKQAAQTFQLCCNTMTNNGKHYLSVDNLGQQRLCLRYA